MPTCPLTQMTLEKNFGRVVSAGNGRGELLDYLAFNFEAYQNGMLFRLVKRFPILDKISHNAFSDLSRK